MDQIGLAVAVLIWLILALAYDESCYLGICSAHGFRAYCGYAHRHTGK